MSNRVLPQAVSTTEFYLYAVLEQVERLADGVEALTAAVAGVDASDSQATEAGLDEERLQALLVAVKGIGPVTAAQVIADYQAGK